MTKKKTPSQNIETDQDNLMTTLESIRTLLEQNEGKLSAARESISIANTNTENDTSALLNMRSGAYNEESVPVLDDIIESDSDSLDNIPELDSIFSVPEIETPPEDMIPENTIQEDIIPEETIPEEPIVDDSPLADDTPEQDPPTIKPDLATLTAKNLLIAALDDLQMDMEESLRETLMKTMVTLEKELKEKINKKIETIKSQITK